jgi:cell division protein FtsB
MDKVQQFVQKLAAGHRLLASALLAIFAVGIFAHVLFGNNGWMSYRQKQTEYQKLQDELQRMDEENRRLDAEIRALKSDPKAIEKEAREQLRYAKPGEVIYLLPEQPGQQSTPEVPQTAERR